VQCNWQLCKAIIWFMKVLKSVEVIKSTIKLEIL